MNKVGIAIVGFGGMGSWHGKRLIHSDCFDLKGIFDIKDDRMAYAKELGIGTFPSLEAVLADKGVEVVLIATPNDLHKPIAIQAMRAGKHVISEKPVTLSSEHLADMIAESEKDHVVFTVHQNRRWDEDFLTMKRVYDEKLLGDVFSIESRVHGSRGIPGDWRGKKEHGGGMMLDWGVHILDQIVLMIPEKVKTVYCKCHHVTNEEVDDGFRAVLTFESGITALLEVGTSNFINLPRWYMQGSNGTAVIEDFKCNGKIVSVTDWDKKDAVPVVTAAGLTKTMAPRTEDSIKETPLPVVHADVTDFYRNVSAVVRGEAELIVKPTQVMRIMKLMEAAFRSDMLGQIVDFE